MVDSFKKYRYKKYTIHTRGIKAIKTPPVYILIMMALNNTHILGKQINLWSVDNNFWEQS
jgi:hypothetical protein